MPSAPQFRDWIETYSSDEFVEVTNWLKNRLDSLSINAPEPKRDEWHHLYLCSTRFELLFFEMAWSPERWPEIVPM
jgi:thiaminase/transcriptional activator TenA